jgi:hypothetical protein
MKTRKIVKIITYVPSKRREELTQAHGATTQNTCFLLNNETDLQLVKPFNAVSFSVGKAATIPLH